MCVYIHIPGVDTGAGLTGGDRASEGVAGTAMVAFFLILFDLSPPPPIIITAVMLASLCRRSASSSSRAWEMLEVYRR